MDTKLHRISNQDKVLGGVTQGFGKHFNIDPTIIKIIFIVLFFTPFPSITSYFILWIALPEKTDSLTYTNTNNNNYTKMSNHQKNGNVVGGLILIVLGSIFAFKTFFHINLFEYIGKMWPLLLVGLGVWLIVKDKIEDNNSNTDNYKDQ